MFSPASLTSLEYGHAAGFPFGVSCPDCVCQASPSWLFLEVKTDPERYPSFGEDPGCYFPSCFLIRAWLPISLSQPCTQPLRSPSFLLLAALAVSPTCVELFIRSSGGYMADELVLFVRGGVPLTYSPRP